jgi:hypothetical protein
MTDAKVTVLVCEASGLLIGVDSGDVYAVLSHAGSERDRAFAGELFGRPVRSDRRARTLVMQRATGARIVVDRVLGMRSLSRADLRPVPPSVRALGAADWVLGLTEIEERLVWLLDLAWIAAESSRGRVT